MINTRLRSHDIEHLDDFELSGDKLNSTLDKIAGINRWLGGNHTTLSGLKRLLKGKSKSEKVKIADLGCGNGDMLRKIAQFGKRSGYDLELIGIDANEHAIHHCEKLSEDFPNICYKHMDVFSEEFQAESYDLVLATLFFHHLKEHEIVDLVKLILKRARFGIIINDLHRHVLAYYLFKLVSWPIRNPIVREDGLTSILRGFKKNELIRMTMAIQAKSEIRWKWAFRYQWLIYN